MMIFARTRFCVRGDKQETTPQQQRLQLARYSFYPFFYNCRKRRMHKFHIHLADQLRTVNLLVPVHPIYFNKIQHLNSSRNQKSGNLGDTRDAGETASGIDVFHAPVAYIPGGRSRKECLFPSVSLYNAILKMEERSA
jgi:hypothetical protein